MMTMQKSDCPLYETIVEEGRQATADEVREWLETLFTSEGRRDGIHSAIPTWLTSSTILAPHQAFGETWGAKEGISFWERISHPSNHINHGESNAPSGLWAHLGLMRLALTRHPEYSSLTTGDRHYHGYGDLYILERAIMWHDLYKLDTAKPGKKTWSDGTPMDTNFKHGPMAAKGYISIAFQCGGGDNMQNWVDDGFFSLDTWDRKQPAASTGAGHTYEQWEEIVRYEVPAILFIIQHHMDMHQVVSLAEEGISTGKWPKNRDFRQLPEELRLYEVKGTPLGDLHSWDWPDFDHLPTNLQNVGFSKADYNRCRMWNCRLLRIFQEIDSQGRFDDTRE